MSPPNPAADPRKRRLSKPSIRSSTRKNAPAHNGKQYEILSTIAASTACPQTLRKSSLSIAIISSTNGSSTCAKSASNPPHSPSSPNNSGKPTPHASRTNHSKSLASNRPEPTSSPPSCSAAPPAASPSTPSA